MLTSYASGPSLHTMFAEAHLLDALGRKSQTYTAWPLANVRGD